MWSWVLTLWGACGIYLAGRRVWWALGNYERRKKLEKAEMNLAAFVLADLLEDDDG